MSSVGDIVQRDFCLLSNIMGLNGALNVVLTAPIIHSKNSTVMSLSINHDHVTQDKSTDLVVRGFMVSRK